MKDVPIPLNLLENDRDRRGLPIPFVVYRDKNGVPHFSVDNVAAFHAVLANGLCGLCGKPLEPGQLWMIGGPLSAFHEEGLYIEPPAHEACARYAVQVCPFIAASNYARRIEGKTLDPDAIHDGTPLHDNGIAPPRPPFFVLTRTSAITLLDSDDGSGQKHIQPLRPWKVLEFWRHGERITQAQAEQIAQASDHTPGQLKWWPT